MDPYDILLFIYLGENSILVNASLKSTLHCVCSFVLKTLCSPSPCPQESLTEGNL